MSAVALSEPERARLRLLDQRALARVLAVYTGASLPAPGTPAVAGSYVLDAEGLHFRPLFPFVSGLSYLARLDLEDGQPILLGFEAAPPAGAPPSVVAVFPSADALPENTLRVYVHFSQPMDVRDAHTHVRLVDASGRGVPLAFVEVPHGLWDPSRTRLTVLFHPGRIKRGVAPGEALGPPLREGERYRLVVDAALRDASGRPLGRGFERWIRATAADRERPRAEAMRLTPPSTRGAAVVLELPEPLDEALLHRMVWVEDAEGYAVPGTVGIEEGETRWLFRPEWPWKPGRYAVCVDEALEDRAGNRFDRAFDRAAADAAAPGGQAVPLRLEFVVQAASR